MTESRSSGPRVLAGLVRLAAWECWRLLRSGLALCVALALGIAWWAQPRAAALLAEQGASAAALLAQAHWEWASLLLIPAVALHGGGLIGRWRSGEGDWLAPRVGQGWALAACTAGISAGACLLALAPAFAGLVSAGPAALTRRAHGHSFDGARIVEPGASLNLVVTAGEHDSISSARVRLARGPGGGRIREARVAAVRADAASERALSIENPTWVELEVPVGAGKLVIGLRNEGEGSLLVPSGTSVEAFAPPAQGPLASLAAGWDPWLRCARALAVIAALAIGFGSWMGAGMAAGCALLLPACLQLAAGPLVQGPWGDLLPWSDLPGSLSLLGEGRLAEAAGALPWLSAAAWIAAGLLLARAGLRGWCAR